MPQLHDSGSSAPVLKCVALYDNVAECSDELAFRSGDVLTVIEQDTSGLQGWWLCSLRGRQGICPGNRLRLLSDSEQALQKEGKRRSWHVQPNKVLMPQKYGDVYLYDMPPTRTTSDQYQYDVPPTTHAVADAGGESYDVPRQLTPSSSVSSLTTDSNRSSLVQEYDVPRKVVGGGAYDVPRELPLELHCALDQLGRLESEATSAVSRLLGHVSPHWRSPSRLSPHRALDLRLAVTRLAAALRDLALFSQAALANAHNAHDKSLAGKLRPLVEAVKEGDRIVGEESRVLEAQGWSAESLAPSPARDPLDTIITCAAKLTDDIRQIASFIQGNSTLLFKRSSGGIWAEEYDYVNLDSRDSVSNKEIEETKLPERQVDQVDCVSPGLPPHSQLDPADKQVMLFYVGQCATHSHYLTNAIDAFLVSVQRNQPPRVFLAHIKFVVLSAHRLVHIGDNVHRNVSSPQVKSRVLLCANSLCEALATTVHKTKLAALHFPSVTSVQEMVDSVIDISHVASQLKRAVAIRDSHSERRL